ncbi:hypothetical protein OPV22_019927 [Ensete ventricosum]|uniref:Uncharacterized protein n=1 Tax=Ensete ventricosum TaxID=4639 RepID=A0AAV8QLW0_ENSVE|nr:hypothetical protein OPV22_019927 [Ensete ventricosum]
MGPKPHERHSNFSNRKPSLTVPVHLSFSPPRSVLGAVIEIPRRRREKHRRAGDRYPTRSERHRSRPYRLRGFLSCSWWRELTIFHALLPLGFSVRFFPKLSMGHAWLLPLRELIACETACLAERIV